MVIQYPISNTNTPHTVESLYPYTADLLLFLEVYVSCVEEAHWALLTQFLCCTAFPTDISRTLLVPLGRQAWEIWYLAGSIGLLDSRCYNHTIKFYIYIYDTIWCRAWYKAQKCYYQNMYVTWHLISLAGISSFGASAENDPTAGALEFDRDLDKVSLWRALGTLGWKEFHKTLQGVAEIDIQPPKLNLSSPKMDGW